MSGIPTKLGELRPAGMVHGAKNYIVLYYDDPHNWEFKQFVTQEQLELFAHEHDLAIIEERKDE